MEELDLNKLEKLLKRTSIALERAEEVINKQEEDIDELKYEWHEGQNFLIIYLRETINNMVKEGCDLADIVIMINTLKPIFKHE